MRMTEHVVRWVRLQEQNGDGSASASHVQLLTSSSHLHKAKFRLDVFGLIDEQKATNEAEMIHGVS